ncbi:MAG: sodium/solute symporter [Candidatus Latescibacteria bacterium]|nr:sodium/solute symporter [Candidatus Latescibacterota bacterium]
MGKLALIDMVIVAAYLVFMMIFGLRMGRFIKNDSDYFLGGKRLPWWAIGMSMVVSDIGALDFVGVAGAAYIYGIALANFEWIGCIPAMMLGAFIFIPFYWKSGVFSVPEFLGRRYNQAVRTIVALIQGVFMVFLLGIFFYTAAKAMNILMGWSEPFSILIIALVVGVYTLFGGLAAVVYTDAVQCIIMFGGSAVTLIVALIKIGGWGELMSQVTAMGDHYAQHFDLMIPMDSSSPYGWAGIIFGLSFVMGPAYWFGNQAIVQRTLGARSEYEAKKSVLWGAFLKLFIPFILVGPGLAGIVLVPGLATGDDVYPNLIHEYLPPGLTGLVFAAFLAALMSSIDSYLNSASTLWTKDIYQALFRPDRSDRHYMIIGKIFITVFLVLGVASAPIAGMFPSLYGYFQTIFSFVQGPLLSIILLGLLWPRATAPGAIAGLGFGVSTSATLFFVRDKIFTAPEPFLYIAFWAFISGFAATVIVSLLTPPVPPERLEGLIFTMRRKKGAVTP